MKSSDAQAHRCEPDVVLRLPPRVRTLEKGVVQPHCGQGGRGEVPVAPLAHVLLQEGHHAPEAPAQHEGGEAPAAQGAPVAAQDAAREAAQEGHGQQDLAEGHAEQGAEGGVAQEGAAHADFLEFLVGAGSFVFYAFAKCIEKSSCKEENAHYRHCSNNLV